MCAQSLSCVQLFETPLTVARQGLLSMRFSRQKYWSVLPCPSPGELPHPGTEPKSPVSTALAGRFFTIQPPGKPKVCAGLAKVWEAHPKSKSNALLGYVLPSPRFMPSLSECVSESISVL